METLSNHTWQLVKRGYHARTRLNAASYTLLINSPNNSEVVRLLNDLRSLLVREFYHEDITNDALLMEAWKFLDYPKRASSPLQREVVQLLQTRGVEAALHIAHGIQQQALQMLCMFVATGETARECMEPTSPARYKEDCIPVQMFVTSESHGQGAK